MSRIKSIIIASGAVICISTAVLFGLNSNAATSGACTHPSTYQNGYTVSSWNGSHTINLGSGETMKCDYMHWVEERHTICTTCRKDLYRQTYEHENHTKCGMNY